MNIAKNSQLIEKLKTSDLLYDLDPSTNTWCTNQEAQNYLDTGSMKYNR